MAAIEKVKVVVCGDSGVGKSSLVHLLSQNEPMTKPSWTIGCSVEVKLHDYKEGTPSQKTYFVELWDVGGSSSHQNNRLCFYNSINGIILVHDLTNRKSQQNLSKWLSEILSKEDKLNKTSCGNFDYDPEQFVDSQVPVLVIGTKLDLAQQVLSPGRTNRSSSFADECGADEFFVDCLLQKSLAPASSNAVKLSRFFDKVIERRFQNQTPYSAILDRRKLTVNNPKANYSHSDKGGHWD